MLIISEKLGRGLNFTFKTDCKVSSVIASPRPLFGLAQIQQQAGRSSRSGALSEICVYTMMNFDKLKWWDQKTLFEGVDSNKAMGDNRFEIATALLRDFEGLPKNTLKQLN